MIELDLDLIQAYHLTIEEFVLLELMRKKYYGKINKYFSNDAQLQTLLDRLVLLGHLKRHPLEDPLVLGGYTLGVYPRYKDSFIETMIDELMDTYPQKVTRPDGTTDYLRSNTKQLREQYKKIIKENKEKHELIIRCLKYQISHFTLTGKLQYMKKLTKWLDNEEWREYEDRVIEQNGEGFTIESSDSIYGNLIT
jgi:hypothetical protein